MRGSLHLVLQPQLCALESTCLASQGFVGVGREAQESRGLENPKERVPFPHRRCRGAFLLIGRCQRRSTERGRLVGWGRVTWGMLISPGGSDQFWEPKGPL